MNFLFFLLSRSLLFVIPPVLQPTGIYLSGDPDVISIADGHQKKQEYRVPNDSVGGQVKSKLADGSVLYVYVNRNEATFNKVMNPPTNEFTEEKLGLLPLNDKKFVIMMHNHLLKMMPSTSEWSVENTVEVINALDNTIHTRVKSPNKPKMSKREMREIREKIEEAQEKGSFDLLKTTASVSSRMTQTQAQSDESE